MALTAHLYRVDEVSAAYLYSLVKRRPLDETLFWLQELEESCYSKKARQLLFLGWAFRVGGANVAWLERWAAVGATREGRNYLTRVLYAIPSKDSSIPWVMAAIAWSEVCPQNLAPEVEADPEEDLFLVALRQKKALAAWWLACGIEEDCVWNLLGNFCEEKRLLPCLTALQDGMGNLSRWALCTAVILTCSISHFGKCFEEVSPFEYFEEKSWSTTVRAGRHYTVPVDCFFGLTDRGAGFRTDEELLDLESFFRKSPLWKARCNWEDDDQKGGFYDTYFPPEEDIPDEWPLKEREKSHGSGLLHNRGASYLRWWRNWVDSSHRFIFGVLEQRVLSNLEKARCEDTSMKFLDMIESIYQQKEFLDPTRLYKKHILEKSGGKKILEDNEYET